MVMVNYSYSPVARIVHALLSLLFGTNPLPYHAFALALGAACGILLYRYLRKLGVSSLPSLFAVAFFVTAVSHQQVFTWEGPGDVPDLGN